MMNFKKVNLFVATLAMVGAMAPAAAFADTPAPTTNTTSGVTDLHGYTKITFTPDKTTGVLTLNQVPNFDWGTHPLAQDYSDMSTDGSSIKVTDLTGTNKGYKVTAKAGKLTNNGAKLLVADLVFKTDDGATTASNGQITGTGDTSIYSDDQTKTGVVATGNTNASGTVESGATHATLKFSGNNVNNGTYQGDVDYTLTSGVN